MATRKAGDAMLQAVYKDILQGRDYQAIDPETGVTPLLRRLKEVGSAVVSPGELREILSYAASPKKTAEMPTADRLELIQDYLNRNVENGAPMVIPAVGTGGVYGASVIDGDRMRAFGLRGPVERSTEMMFIPGADPRVTHVLEGNIATPGEITKPYLMTLGQDRARSVYNAARGMGYRPDDEALDVFMEFGSWQPGVGPLTRQLARTGAPPFLIVPSRGGPFDVLGMRQNGATMATVQAPGQPGWLGNPFVAQDAGGQLTRQQATQKFADLVEEKAQDAAWRDAFLGLTGKRVGYYKPQEEYIHLHGLQDWISRNSGAAQ